MRNERGASAVEYGLLVAGIAAWLIIVTQMLGVLIQGAYVQTACNLAADGTPPSAVSCG